MGAGTREAWCRDGAIVRFVMQVALGASLILGFGAAPATAKEFTLDFCSQAAGSLGGQCNGPRGVAVNETGNGGVAAGTVYVADDQNYRLQSFDADGDFIRAWGWDVVSGGGTGLEICEVAANCQAGTEGGGAGQFNRIAGGIAVNQATGNVYVVDRNNFRIQQFDAVGNFVRTWGADVDSTGGTGFEICEVAANCKAGIEGTGAGMFGFSGSLVGIATDSSGNVYVADAANSRVQKFSSSGAFLAMGGWDVISGGSTGYEVCTVAAECKTGAAGNDPDCQFAGQSPGHLATSPAGEVYVVDPGNEMIHHLSPALACDPTFDLPIVSDGEASDGALRAIAVNGADGHLFVSKSIDPTIYEVDPVSREVIEETAAGAANWLGLAVNSTSGRMYAASGDLGVTGHVVRAFDLGSLPGAVTSPNLPALSGTTATVKGWVNPVGVALTECAFEYTDAASFEAEGFAGAEEASCAESLGAIGSGTEPVSVHADLDNLNLGTEYRFRLVAANANGKDEGKAETFLTVGPKIEATWSEDVTLTETSLKAEVNPKGSATTYHFEYGTSEAYGQQTAELPLGSDEASHEVIAFLAGLQPGTTYHYRIVATNSDGVAEGPDRTFTTYSKPTLEPCANDAFRVGPAAGLPDCRAYEMVSPPDKGGGDIVAKGSADLGREAAYRQASIDGNRVTYTSTTAFGDAVRGSIASQYLSSRGAGGWSTHGLNPPQGTTVFDPEFDLNYDLGTNFLAFTPDLCGALIRDHNLTPLDADALADHTNLYRRTSCGPDADSYEALTTALAAPAAVDLVLWYASYSPDLSHVVFGADAALESTPAAGTGTNQQLYDLSGGELRLVSVLPNGEASGAAAALGSAYVPISHGRESPLERAISADGSRIFWTAAGHVYARLDGSETVAVSESVTSASAQFWTASSDGSRAVFSFDPGGPGLKDLYEFDVDAETAVPIAGEVGGVVGASEDLSRLYFTSREALAPGSVEGEYNLYLRVGGEVRLMAALAVEDGPAAGTGVQVDSAKPFPKGSRVSTDGRQLVFMSTRPLSGYDNTDAVTGEAASEVFRYDAEASGGKGELLCVSCKPSGARPVGRKLDPLYGPGGTPPHVQTAAWIPTFEWSNHGKRALSADGNRVLFNAYDDLALRDNNGAQDVYQWEAPGTGTCDTDDADYSQLNGGCLSLISTGQSPAESELLDASADGRDVFFTTSSSIDPRDPGSVDLYDAREGGGFAPPPPPPPPCLGDACQPVPTPPGVQTPASATFRGPGNTQPARDCRAKARRAARLARLAKKSEGHRATQLAKQAKRLAKASKRCRRGERKGQG
jgi:DNA-binding beta-propeller fold protein YncE